MKFEEALKLLREGKKIRRSCWRKNVYFVKTKNGATTYIDGEEFIYRININTILENDWELYEEPILDKKEKEYLSAVIKPFKVEFIQKNTYKTFDNCREWIFICLENDDHIVLPDFHKNTMYKGMEIGKKYTLKELGL